MRVLRKSIAINLAAAVFTVGAAVSAAQAPYFLPSLVTIAGNGISGYTGDSGLGTAAEISNTVSAGTFDPAGNFYIADTKNNVIRKITPAGIITTFAGNGTAGYLAEPSLALNAEFSSPSSVRYYQGGIYVTDFTNGRIRRIDLITNIINTVAGGGTLSLKNTTNANTNPYNTGPTISIPQPQEVAFDNLGNMYWSQGGGTSRVNVMNLSTTIVHLFAGTGGTAGATGTNVSAANPSQGLTAPENTILNGTEGLAVDAQNNVYISETATHVVRKITIGANPAISTYAGIGIGTGAAICSNATNSVGDGCPATGANFGTVEHMSIDGAGNIYLADTTNNRVRVIPPNPSNPAVGGTVYTLIGNGTAADSTDGTYAAAASVGSPYDSQILPDGDVLLIDRTVALTRLLHQPGQFLTTAVGSTSAVQAFNVLTQATTGTFSLATPSDFSIQGTPVCVIAVGLTGKVCTAKIVFTPSKAGNRTVQLKFTDSVGSAVAGLSGMGVAPVASLLPGLTSTAAGTGVAGATGDGSAASAATFQTPGATAIDNLGNVYVADATANEVRKFTAGGTITRVAGTGTAGSSGDGALATAATLSGPSGVAVDATGNVYIADTGNNKIRMVSAATGNISTVAGTGTAGYTGDQGTPAAATLHAPMQLAWSPLGILYVADSGNNVVRSISFNEQLITTVAGNGTASFDGDGGAGPLAELTSPQGVAVDGSDNVYIADTGNNRIRKLSQGYISTLAGETGSSFNGDGPAATATLGAPAGVAADLAGNVYVADTANQRIRLITSGQIITIMGTGAAGATGDGGSSNLAAISSPQAIALDSAGNVYIADTGNHKVRSIAVNANSLTFKTLNPGESSPAQTVTLYDTGNQNLAVGSVTVPAGYIEQASTSGTDCTSAPISVIPGAGCNLNTVLNPPVIGLYNGAVTVADNSENIGTAAQSIAVMGTSAYVYTATLTLPSNATAGSAVTGTLAVTNPLKPYTGTVTYTSTDPLAVLPANYTFTTANNGMASPSITFKTSGPQCVTVTDTSNATVTSTACTSVGSAAAAKITVYGGNNQTANVITAYAQHLVAYVTDAYGNAVANAAVVFTINASGSTTGTFSTGGTTSSVQTSTSGYATAATVISGATIGTYSVTAVLTGTSATAGFNLSTFVLGSFTIAPTNAQVGPIAPGISSTQNLIVTAAGGFTAPITFTCTAPTGITCTVGPNPFFIATQVNYPASVNFTSEGQILGTVSGFGSPWSMLAAFIAGAVLLLRRRRLSVIVLALLAFAVLNTLSGCGQSYAPVTSNGTYTVMITGTAQTATATTSITYTIQK
jgi:sugar lactone lactonase YvrE